MKFYFLYAILFSSVLCVSQDLNKSLEIEKNDLEIFKSFLPDFEINASDNQYLRKWNRTKYYVKSVYDYSVIASAMLFAFEDTLSNLSNKSDQNRYLKKANKMLKQEFGYEVKNMSISRGTFLMKLIYRNTGLSAYDIIKKYRGSGTAFWFQSLCVINGQDLKKQYDPENEDFLVEKAVQMIENGEMDFLKRVPITKTARKALEKKKKKERKARKKKKKKEG